jgi:hypothetical protein
VAQLGNDKPTQEDECRQDDSGDECRLPDQVLRASLHAELLFRFPFARDLRQNDCSWCIDASSAMVSSPYGQFKLTATAVLHIEWYGGQVG